MGVKIDFGDFAQIQVFESDNLKRQKTFSSRYFA